jgi:hypothetical protein
VIAAMGYVVWAWKEAQRREPCTCSAPLNRLYGSRYQPCATTEYYRILSSAWSGFQYQLTAIQRGVADERRVVRV